MEMDPRTLDLLRSLEPRKAYQAVRDAVLQNPWGASSADLLEAMRQVVEAGILTWDEVEEFEGS